MAEQRVPRRLAAIVAADVVEYEAGTLAPVRAPVERCKIRLLAAIVDQGRGSIPVRPESSRGRPPRSIGA
jgi:hypothetical protein